MPQLTWLDSGEIPSAMKRFKSARSILEISINFSRSAANLATSASALVSFACRAAISPPPPAEARSASASLVRSARVAVICESFLCSIVTVSLSRILLVAGKTTLVVPVTGARDDRASRNCVRS
eukprot:scaffold210470_cov28-Tisochrysis_lutea.AAC.2